MPKERIRADEIDDITERRRTLIHATEADIEEIRYAGRVDPTDARYALIEMRIFTGGIDEDSSPMEYNGRAALVASLKLAVGILIGGGYVDSDSAAAIINDFIARNSDGPDLYS